MSSTLRLFASLAMAACLTGEAVAQTSSSSAAANAGSTVPGQSGPLEFGGVTSVGKKTMINLYNKADQRSFWVEVGATSDGVTVVKYDADHDQVTIRQNGAERTLPLRPPSAVVAGNATLAAAPGQAATGGATATTTTSLSQARQEEEARMLVSDLLEIGMIQRMAYEDAQRRAAAGQPAQPPGAQPAAGAAPAPTGSASATPATAQPANSGTASGS